MDRHADEIAVAERRRRWLVVDLYLLACVTLGGLFLYSGQLYHGPRPAHRAVGTVGWILAGLAPLIAYLCNRLLRRGWPFRPPRYFSPFLIAWVIFALLTVAGLLLLTYGVGEQTTYRG